MTSKKNIFGIPITAVTLANVVNHIDALMGPGKKSIFYVNPHIVNIAFQDSELLSILKNGSLIIPDGTGIILASKILNTPLIERTTPMDFIDNLLKHAEHKRWNVFFLGGNKKVAKRLKKKLTSLYPSLNVSGIESGYFNGLDEEKIINTINRKKPDLLLVGLGAPKQEKWIAQNIQTVNAKVFFAVGALLDTFSEVYPRAPKIFTDHGMEWVFRLFLEPQRMWKRYTYGNIIFFVRVLREKISRNHVERYV